MNLVVQYAIVFVLVAAAAWSAWRMLRGRKVLGRGAKSTDPGSCASCSSSTEHRPPR
jgi:hypothetical protein